MIDSTQIDILGLAFYNERTEESFNELYKKLNPLFWSYVWKNFKIISHAKKKNIHAEFFMNIWSKIDQYNPKLPFSPWAVRSLRNQCLQTFRTSMDGPANMKGRPNRLFISTEFIFDENKSSENLEFTAATSENNIEDWINSEYEEFSTSIVLKAIENLPYPYGEILVDKFLNGYSYEELTELYNCNLNTAKTWVRAAIHYIRKQLFPSDPKRVDRARHRTAKEKLREKGEWPPKRKEDPKK
jgi:RNA polymerase sigma factor (sigma-70 family)